MLDNTLEMFFKKKDTVIDIVYTWVDPKDEEWIIQRNKFKGIKSVPDLCRYNSDLNEIYYSIKSIEKYFNHDYRNIYIVSNTSNKPSFLKKFDNIIMIKDKDLVGDYNYNSQAIESVIHKIPGISEYYIYFNDDMLLYDNLDIDDFIYGDKIIWYKETDFILTLGNKIPELEFLIDETSVAMCRKKLYEKFGKEYKNWKPIAHCPKIFKKSYVLEFEKKFEKELEKLRKERFRSNKTFLFIDCFCIWGVKKNYINYKNNYKTLILLHSDESIMDKYNKFNKKKSEKSKFVKKNLCTDSDSVLLKNNNRIKFLCIEDIRKKKNKSSYLVNLLENI